MQGVARQAILVSEPDAAHGAQQHRSDPSSTCRGEAPEHAVIAALAAFDVLADKAMDPAGAKEGSAAGLAVLTAPTKILWKLTTLHIHLTRGRG